jgi:hypothetical protein
LGRWCGMCLSSSSTLAGTSPLCLPVRLRSPHNRAKRRESASAPWSNGPHHTLLAVRRMFLVVGPRTAKRLWAARHRETGRPPRGMACNTQDAQHADEPGGGKDSPRRARATRSRACATALAFSGRGPHAPATSLVHGVHLVVTAPPAPPAPPFTPACPSPPR